MNAYTGGIQHWVTSEGIMFPSGTQKLDAQRAAEAIAPVMGLSITGVAYQRDSDYAVIVPISK